ncbi:uncharacterized protein LOC129602836 [Paramacrobiotus metropolitanus]|uniref:uncharacterized protein LOC129602836 n=1 Tax=Paramacrobiotus metropolitanus TaxID=2943436 RepID=UPI0024463651|nr:uncharacterized protein LOC129602836 [Paramacrobiotus metropolitanus]
MMKPLAKTALKVGVAIAALEATSWYGIWKDSQAATTGYQDAKDSFIGTVVPQLKPYADKIPFPDVKAPQIDCRETWNRWVLCGISMLSNAPTKICEFASTAWDKMSKKSI